MSPYSNTYSRKKVAIVGSGCSGIAALWALNRTYHDVHLYEAADRLGGHTNTVQWNVGKYKTSVDTGFIVLNSATYPNFLNFLKKAQVETEPTEMGFSVSRDQGAFEWATSSLSGIFCQKRRIFSLRTWRMIFDIVRFNQFAVDLLHTQDDGRPSASRHSVNGIDGEETIGSYLAREGYSDAFRDDYLLPIAAALWSTSPDKCSLDFPAATLVRFLWNHHLLSTITARPEWLTLKNGAQSYIDSVMRGFPPNHLHLKTAVRNLTNDTDGSVLLHLENGQTEKFDHVILATHADEALSILGTSATAQERSILSCFEFSQNEAVLHSDLNFMPQRKKAWSSWNYLTQSTALTGKANASKVSLTYNMNILQRIPRNPFGDILVTINPLQRPQPSTVQGRYYYSHPLYTAAAVRAQRQLRHIQNKRGISYIGAWTNYGFHEDGFSSGLAVAKDHLGAKLPFEFKDSIYSRGKVPQLGLRDYIWRFLILFIHVFVVLVIERLAAMGQRRSRPVLKKKLGGKLH